VKSQKKLRASREIAFYTIIALYTVLRIGILTNAQRSVFLETEIAYNRTCRVDSDPKSVNGDKLPHINFQQVMSPYPTTAHPSHPTFQVPGQAKCVPSRKLRSSSSSTSVRVSKSTLITINTVRNSKSVLINNSTSTAPQDLNKQPIKTAVALRSQLQQ
jgi:hypothetical protein